MPPDDRTVSAASALPVPADPAIVLHAMPDGVVVADAHGLICYANPRAAKLMGAASDEELLGRPIREALPLIDSTGHHWWDVVNPWGGLATRTGHRERMVLFPGRGHLLVTMSFTRPARSHPVEQVIVTLRDTELRRRAEAGNAELISLVAHELRAPLTSVRGFSSTLLRRWERFTDEQKRLMIETIEVDAGRLSRLIHELLDVSRIDTRRLRVTPQLVDLRATITAHIERQIAGGYDADRFRWDETELPPLEVWADPDRLDQVLANLLENALKHGGGVVTMVTATPATKGGMVSVTVTDEGEGIPPDLYPLVFTKFWHGSRRGSTGLGLYLVRGIVEAHGGTVLVDRAPTGGALFRFTVPTVPPDLLLA